MKPAISISYLSHGPFETGGFRHEKLVFDTLAGLYRSRGYEVQTRLLRDRHFFRGFLQHLSLFLRSFRRADADINIVVARCAVPAMLRNTFSKRRTFVVLHNFDERDNKSAVMRMYYSWLFHKLSKAKSPKTELIVVSPFWKQYFAHRIHNPEIVPKVFPNLFDTAYYRQFVTAQKESRIHLGQFSAKNDEAIYDIAKELAGKGWSCYFSTLNPAEAAAHNGTYEVLYFDTFDTYLQCMAASAYTLSLPKVNEGWNRLAHESLLVGTQLIAYDRGGLGDLLRASGAFIAENADDCIRIIEQAEQKELKAGFIEAFDLSKAAYYAQQLL